MCNKFIFSSSGIFSVSHPCTVCISVYFISLQMTLKSCLSLFLLLLHGFMKHFFSLSLLSISIITCPLKDLCVAPISMHDYMFCRLTFPLSPPSFSPHTHSHSSIHTCVSTHSIHLPVRPVLLAL